MKLSDTLMILLFPFLDSMPYTLPRYWTYRDKLRIPFRYVVILQSVLTAVYSSVFYYINLGGYENAARWTTLMRYFFLFTYLAMAFLLIKDSLSKLLFTWLLFFSWQLFVLGNANFIESRFFWEFSDLHPYLVYNIARIIIYLITCPVLLHFFRHTVADALKIRDDRMWRYFWIIPLFSLLFGLLYCTVTDVYAYASWQFLASRYFMLLGTCYVSYVALKVLEISHSRTQLEEALKYADKNMMAQMKQYDSLASHMDEMRKARHDLRQHLAVVQSYIERDDRTGLAEYIDIYKSKLPSDMAELFCSNEVVNAIISYYVSLARDAGIPFMTKVDYPRDCPLPDTDMTVLLGNLLENAVEACKREAGDSAGQAQFIKLRIRKRGQSTLMVMVDNPCRKPVAFDGDTPLSSKRDGAGIGVASVREIASRYDGEAVFEQKDGVFYASVILGFPKGNGAAPKTDSRDYP